jgi:hypothetical protein
VAKSIEVGAENSLLAKEESLPEAALDSLGSAVSYRAHKNWRGVPNLRRGPFWGTGKVRNP